jgi:hypothetical protein
VVLFGGEGHSGRSHFVTRRGCLYEHGELGGSERSGGSLVGVEGDSGVRAWSIASVSLALAILRGGDIPVGW